MHDTGWMALALGQEFFRVIAWPTPAGGRQFPAGWPLCRGATSRGKEVRLIVPLR